MARLVIRERCAAVTANQEGKAVGGILVRLCPKQPHQNWREV
jgi:hypothetical protein